ncbi:hypothetical protein FXN65_10595 [Metapseudomonas lalkuanensis]|uniref:Uncharacterized protein n=1 Tax=Metapseudomonas lalkuanensis TaxID=2604832 RepID=A0A5J6QLI8_9GAMM|nr:hypothetical protein [Pseudomonas lalkuanensis]QEY62502.1 hypothetical protein FXN65_10595 [Pseudomonas lalkuanensis]
MNKAQQVFVESSLGMALLLVSIGWAVLLAWQIGAPFLPDGHSFVRFVEGILTLDRAALLVTAKGFFVLLWIWLCVYVRLGMKRESMH